VVAEENRRETTKIACRRRGLAAWLAATVAALHRPEGLHPKGQDPRTALRGREASQLCDDPENPGDLC